MSCIDEPLWDAFVAAHPKATFFHLSAWRHVAAAVFGHRPHYLTVSRGEEVAAILPLVEVRSRFFGHALISNAFCVGGGPLAADPEAQQVILDRAEQLGRRLGVDYVELRDTPDSPPGWTRRADLYAGFEKSINPSEAENFRQIPKRQRAVLRKAMDRNLQVSADPSPSTFYPLYARAMRDHGTPALPRSFFDKLLSVFGSDCEILTVRQEGRPVSSVLSYYFQGRVMPYYAGSVLEARQLGSNDLLYWRLMSRAADRGCTTFDFGRSKLGTGPFSFKRNWGFEPRPMINQFHTLGSAEAPSINPTNPKYSTLIKAWRRLPLPVANAISPLLSRGLA